MQNFDFGIRSSRNLSGPAKLAIPAGPTVLRGENVFAKTDSPSPSGLLLIKEQMIIRESTQCVSTGPGQAEYPQKYTKMVTMLLVVISINMH